MKKGLKLFGLSLFLVVVIFGLTGCGNDNDNKKENETKVEEVKSKATSYGWYEVEIPEGFEADKYGSEFKSKESSSTKIKVMLEKNTFRKAQEAAEKDAEYTDHEFAGEIKLGDYTWYKVTFPWNDGKESVKYFADVNDTYYVAIDTFMLSQGDETAENFIKSIKIADGNLNQLKSDFASKQK